ncbi:glutathione peroxidase [Aridibaculum aurantiacum]|uniref:glutathione peroxidase n=1 Tax=Aridibaculum aurantiacum TaxID=2810307 RepID=UPI001F625898|nr:glutathione peroxidase [Aridibaculum aurantiacum]
MTQQKTIRIKRRIFRTIYPVLLKAGKVFGMNTSSGINIEDVAPDASFHELKALANNGTPINFSQYRGKKVMVVNTASQCGYTPQLSELKKLQELYRGKLEIIGFPSNDFKEQEKGTDEQIATFCIGTYGIQFPLVKKSRVRKGEGQHEVFQWLTQKEKNGWNDKEPGWNFTKYLVNEQGILTHYFGAGVSPLSKQVIHALGLK